LKTLITNKKIISDADQQENLYTQLIITAGNNNRFHILEYLLLPATITALSNLINTKPSLCWKTLFKNKEIRSKKRIAKLFLQYNHLKKDDSSLDAPLRIASMQSLEWANKLIDAGIDYNSTDFIFLGFLSNTITKLDDLNFFKELAPTKQNNFIQRQLHHIAQHGTKDLLASNIDFCVKPFIISKFIKKILPPTDLTQKNEHGYSPLDITYREYKKSEKLLIKNDLPLYMKAYKQYIPMLVYLSFLKCTPEKPIMSPIKLYWTLKAGNFLVSDAIKEIISYYIPLTIEYEVHKKFVQTCKLKKNEMILPDNVHTNFQKEIDEQYKQRGYINPNKLQQPLLLTQ